MPERIWKGDRWTRALGSRVPTGAVVSVERFMPRRRAVIRYEGETVTTMLWCLAKPAPATGAATEPPARDGAGSAASVAGAASAGEEA